MGPRLKDVTARAVRLTGLPALVRATAQRRRVTILLYHRPTPETLDDHLRYLARVHAPIALGDYLAARAQGRLADLPPRPLVVTFDDGHRTNADLVPVLRRHGVRPTIFLCSGIVGTDLPFWFDVVGDPQALKRLPDAERVAAVEGAGRPSGAARAALSAEEVEAMRPDVDFEAHTVSHPILPRCDDAKAAREIAGCREELADRLGVHAGAFAYPNGDYGEREIRLVRDAGFTCALTVDPGFNDAETDPMRLRRLAIDDDADGVNVMALKACGVWDGAKRLAARGAAAPVKVAFLCPPALEAWKRDAVAAVVALDGVEPVGCLVDARSGPSAAARLRANLRRGRGGYVLVMAVRALTRRGAGESERTEAVMATHAIAVTESADPYGTEAERALRGLAPDVLVLLGGFGIVREPLLSLAPLGVLSYHHGNMRRYRGQPPGFWELYEGEDTMGVTVQRLRAGLDDGEPVAERSVTITSADTPTALRERILTDHSDLMADAVVRVADPGYVPQPLEQTGRLYTLPNLRQWLTCQWRVRRRQRVGRSDRRR